MHFQGHYYAHYSTSETDNINHFLMLRQVEKAANELFEQQEIAV